MIYFRQIRVSYCDFVKLCKTRLNLILQKNIEAESELLIIGSELQVWVLFLCFWTKVTPYSSYLIHSLLKTSVNTSMGTGKSLVAMVTLCGCLHSSGGGAAVPADKTEGEWEHRGAAEEEEHRSSSSSDLTFTLCLVISDIKESM